MLRRWPLPLPCEEKMECIHPVFLMAPSSTCVHLEDICTHVIFTAEKCEATALGGGVNNNRLYLMRFARVPNFLKNLDKLCHSDSKDSSTLRGAAVLLANYISIRLHSIGQILQAKARLGGKIRIRIFIIRITRVREG